MQGRICLLEKEWGCPKVTQLGPLWRKSRVLTPPTPAPRPKPASKKTGPSLDEWILLRTLVDDPTAKSMLRDLEDKGAGRGAIERYPGNPVAPRQRVPLRHSSWTQPGRAPETHCPHHPCR